MSARSGKRHVYALATSFLLRVAPWFALQTALVHAKAPASLQPLLPHFVHLFEFAWQAGLASIFIEEVVHAAVSPSLKEIASEAFIPALEDCMTDFTRTMADAIAKKDITLKTIAANTQPSTAAEAMGDDPALAEVKDLLANNKVAEAITKARPLVQKDKKYLPALLDALVFSSREEDWDEAESYLQECGDSRHYRRLAFDYWSIGKVAEAIAVAEDGLEIARKNPPDLLELAKFQNSLAYYYAEAAVHEKSKEAKTLIETAMKSIKGKGDARLEASFLATRGFVRIAFGSTQDEVMKGLHECEKGRDSGARHDLYFHHSRRAEQRLVALNAIDAPTSRPDPKSGGKRRRGLSS